MKHKDLYGKSIRESFREFVQENPDVMKKFEDLAFKLIERGHIKISSKLICEQIRWEHFMKTTDKDFKINNSYTSFLARIFIKRNPEYKDVFTTRKLRSEEPAPFMNKDEHGQLTFL